MHDVDELELAALGARPLRKPRPWGWFFALLLLIAMVTFVLSFYLPLKSAFQKLLGEHETLAKKARELDSALVSTKSSLDATELKRASLQKGVDENDGAERAAADRLTAVRALIEKQLGTSLTQVSIVLEGAELALRVDAAKVIAPTGKVLPFGVKPLCAAASAANKEPSARVVAEVPVLGDQGDVWGDAAKAAAGVADTLVARCKLPRERLSVSLVPAEGESAKLGLLVRSVASR